MAAFENRVRNRYERIFDKEKQERLARYVSAQMMCDIVVARTVSAHIALTVIKGYMESADTAFRTEGLKPMEVALYATFERLSTESPTGKFACSERTMQRESSIVGATFAKHLRQVIKRGLIKQIPPEEPRTGRWFQILSPPAWLTLPTRTD